MAKKSSVVRRPANEALAGVPVNDLAAGVSTKKLYRNAHFTLERAPRLSVADMNATMTPRRGLRVAELAAAVGVSADTIRYYERTGLLLARARTPSGYRATRRPVRLVRTIAR
jgi:MerR family regulatory protein